MKKIAIIGTENSHASAFANLLANNEKVKIIGAFGTEPEANQRFSEKFGIDCSAASAADFADEVDGVMITSRKGSTHFDSALPYLTEGKTVFIDKPITVDVDQSLTLARIAKENNVKLCGGSCIKYSEVLAKLKREIARTEEDVCAANFCAPVELESPHDGFFFYAQHLVEMCLSIFGNGVKTVYAVRCGDKVCATLNYGSFAATLSFGSNIYHTTIVFRNFERHANINNVVKLYANELNYFLSLLGGRKMRYSYDEVIFPVIILNAINDSFRTGKEIAVPDIRS